jgi:hypothetical protein
MFVELILLWYIILKIDIRIAFNHNTVYYYGRSVLFLLLTYALCILNVGVFSYVMLPVERFMYL